MRLSIIFIGHDSRAFLDEQRSCREAFAGPGVDIDVRSIKGGPETLERELDEVQAGPWIIEEAVAAEKEGADAVMVDCAMDPCLQALRQALSVPVIGAGIAAFSQAIAIADRFSIIAPVESLVPAYRRKINEYCLSPRLASIRSISVPILNLLSETAVHGFIRVGLQAVEKDGADALVIGCTGLSPVFPRFKRELQVPVMDPVAAGIHLASALVESNQH